MDKEQREKWAKFIMEYLEIEKRFHDHMDLAWKEKKEGNTTYSTAKNIIWDEEYIKKSEGIMEELNNKRKEIGAVFKNLK